VANFLIDLMDLQTFVEFKLRRDFAAQEVAKLAKI
jgi:hypothetical protein